MENAIDDEIVIPDRSLFELKIDPEFARVIPPLRDEEYARLKTSLVTDGFLPALGKIIVWIPEMEGVPVIVDGMNRYKICVEHGLEFEIEPREFACREDVMNWIISNQLGRRNLTEEQYSYLRGKRYNTNKQPRGGDRKSKNVKKSKGQSDPLISTSEKIAKEDKVGPKTVKRDAQFASAVDTIANNTGINPQQLLTGEIKITRKDVIKLASQPLETQQKIIHELLNPTIEPEEPTPLNRPPVRQPPAKKEEDHEDEDEEMPPPVENKTPSPTPAKPSLSNVMNTVIEAEKEATTEEIECLPEYDTIAQQQYAEFVQLVPSTDEIAEGVIDHVITIIEAGIEVSPVGDLAERVLKSGGSLFVQCEIADLPNVIFQICLQPGLIYHWVINNLTFSEQQPDAGVNSFWKPILWFTKGEFAPREKCVDDVIKRNLKGTETPVIHSGMVDLIERFTSPRDVIADPLATAFVGPATLLAGERIFVGVYAGIDLDETLLQTLRDMNMSDLDAILYFLKRQAKPASTEAIADGCQILPKITRRILRWLAKCGKIVVDAEQTSGSLKSFSWSLPGDAPVAEIIANNRWVLDQSSRKVGKEHEKKTR